MAVRKHLTLAAAGLMILLAWASTLALVAKGAIAPDFTLKTTDNKTVKLADLKGKPVILDFWAAWCPPCRRAMPELQKLYVRYQPKGVVVLGITLDTGRSEAERIARAAGVKYQLLLDRDRQVAGKYGVVGLPTIVVLNRQGQVVASEVGYRGPQALEELFKQALK